MQLRSRALMAALAAAVTSASAAVASPVIVARTGVTGFNLPNGSSINSSTVTINDLQQLAVRVNVVGGTGGSPGLFYGGYAGGVGSGGVAYLAASGDIISDPDLNDLGAVAFFNLETSNVVAYDPINGGRIMNKPLGVTSISGTGLTNSGLIGGRASFGFTGTAAGTFPQQTSGNPPFNSYVVSTGIDASSPYSFLFVPDMAQNTAQLGMKVQLASGGNQILRVNPDGSTSTIAADRSADGTSPFNSFINSVSISDDGTKVAFQARLFGTTTDAIYLWDALTSSLTPIATEGSGGVAVIDAFAADVNNLGQVVFRGNDSSGSNSVFLFDGSTLSRVIGTGDMVQTDIGLRQLGRGDGQTSQSGGPRINNLGDISYIFQYFDPTNPNSVADGTLVMVTPIPEPAAGLALAGAGLLALRRRRR